MKDVKNPLHTPPLARLAGPAARAGALVCAFLGVLSPANAAPAARSGAVVALQQGADIGFGATGAAPGATDWQARISRWAREYAARALALDGSAPGDTRARTAASSSASAPAVQDARVDVEIGALDPRLHLAPCEKVDTYVPQGFWLWGKTRVGLRCERGTTHWNVYLPVTVHVWGKALVAASMLPAGARLQPGDLREVEVDLAADSSPALRKMDDAVGRQLVRGMQPGESLRQSYLRPRRWFAAGDPVELEIHGRGFVVKADATALGPGDENQCVRVRTDSGRLVCGQAIGEHLVQVDL